MAYSAFPLPLAQCTAYLVSMVGHGFNQNDVLYNNAGTLALAQANNATTANVIGVVWQVIDTDSFVMVLSGWVNLLDTLTANVQYYLSDSVAGGLTTTAPSGSSYVIPILFTDSTTSGYFRIGPVIDTFPVSPLTVVTVNTNMAAGNVYASNAGGSINFLLPATYSVGAEFGIIDHSGNGFVITQTLGGVAQQVCDLGLASTAGAAGTVTTTVAGQTIFLKAIVANGALRVTSSKGTFVYA